MYQAAFTASCACQGPGWRLQVLLICCSSAVLCNLPVCSAHADTPASRRTPALTGWLCLLQTVVAAGLLTYGAVGAAALSTPKIAYKTIEVSCLG